MQDTGSFKSGQLIGVLIGLQMAILLSALDQTVLNTAIPKMSILLNGFDRSVWIITSYLLFSTVATPVAGKLSDIFGSRTMLIMATALFVFASALCGCAGVVPFVLGLDGMNQLILFRALQGIAGGAMIGLCFISIADLFPARQRGKYQGFLAAAFIVAAIVGPVLGGFLVDSGWWRYIFFMNVPFGALAIICFALYFPASLRPRAAAVIDFVGISTLILCIFPLILGVSALGRESRFDVSSSAMLIFSLIMFIAFIRREQTAKEPLIPPYIFKERLINISLYTVFVSGIGLFGSMLLLSMMMQGGCGLSASNSGVLLIPLMLVVALSSVAGGLIMARTGKYKTLCIFALTCLSGGSIALSLNTSLNVFLFLCEASVAALGLGLLLPIQAIIVQNVVAGRVTGIATAMTQFFRSLGGTIGTGVMSGVLLALMKHESLLLAINHTFLIYGCFVASAVVLNFFLPEIALKNTQAETDECELTPVGGAGA